METLEEHHRLNRLWKCNSRVSKKPRTSWYKMEMWREEPFSLLWEPSAPVACAGLKQFPSSPNVSASRCHLFIRPGVLPLIPRS